VDDGAVAGTGTAGVEALIGFLSGAAFGMISPVVGHPFDLVKTKMQTSQSSPSASGTTPKHHGNATSRDVVRRIYRTEGLRGFYKGFVPPFVASIGFRSAQFTAYSAAFASCSHVPMLDEPIPHTAGLRPAVLLGAFAAAASRAVIETPLEYIKIKIMTNESSAATSTAAAAGKPQQGFSASELTKAFTSHPLRFVRQTYSGFTPTLLRSMGLLGSFFVMVDYSTRYIPHVINAPLIGPFFKGGICATAAWAVCFPFETAKSVVQSQCHKYKDVPFATFVVMKRLYRERGIRHGLYRGFLPGASRSFFANGASMLVYTGVQSFLREQGNE